ncbi:MAG: hypothetical protein KDE27_26555 [Planctomycetes bacterium]|nr:hypothetical protein [Planctomycetota bacterium]
MQHASRFGILAAALASTAAAQDFIGFTYNEQVGATSRGSLGGAAGEVITRIDGDEYGGWGTDTAGMRTISSIFMIIQDQDAVATAETFDIYLYAEDPLNPGFPDLTTKTTFAMFEAGPPAPTTGVISASAKVVTPATPVAVPIQGGGDIFISFEFAAAPGLGWPTDGLSSQICLGTQPSASFTVFDIPGGAQQPSSPAGPNNSHGLSNLGGALTYSSTRNWVIDVEHSTAGGVVLGVTNQTSCVGSNNPPPTGFGPAPGTADFMSGVSPDVVGFNAGRADDVTMEYFRVGSGTPLVFFLADIGGFAAEMPLSGLVAGATGVSCVNIGSFLTLGFVVGSGDEAFLTTTFPAAVRPTLAGFPLIQQAVEFDTANGTAHASPCGRQVF